MSTDATAQKTSSQGPLSGVASGTIFLVEVLLSTSLWGPQPLGWLWVGSQADFLTDSLSAGLAVAFMGSVVSIITTVWIVHHIDRWRRAHLLVGSASQKPIALETIFVISALIAVVAFSFWFFILAGPGSSLAPRV